jgi:hypothetical protein
MEEAVTTVHITIRPAQPELPYQRTTAVEAATIIPAHSTAMSLVKYQPPAPAPDVDAFMLAMFLMYARAPKKAEPDVDGSYSLGEIGMDAEKTWSRLTPYSVARREP